MRPAATIPLQKRKKPMTYGKAARTVSYAPTNQDAFLDDELALSESTHKPLHQVGRGRSTPTVKDTYFVQKPENNAREGKATIVKDVPVESIITRPAVKRTRKRHEFEVPSSDEEESPPRRRPTSPGKLARRTAPILAQDEPERLAPWEHHNVVGADTALTAGRIYPETLKDRIELISKTSHQPRDSRESARVEEDMPKGTSALELLRRKKASSRSIVPTTANEPKKSTLTEPKPASGNKLTSSKRRRAVSQTLEDFDNVDTSNTGTSPSYAVSSPPRKAATAAGMSIFDFPGSGADELLAPSMNATSSSRSAEKTILKTSGQLLTRSAPRKGLSAPARLAQMLHAEDDTTEPDTATPSASSSRSATPHKAPPSTPPRKSSSSPETVIKVGSLTPKQTRLWSQLLTSDPLFSSSPSALTISKLEISGHRRTAKRAVGFRSVLTKSKSDIPRTRLVDCLRASALGSEDEDEDDNEYAGSDNDTEMRDGAAPELSQTPESAQPAHQDKSLEPKEAPQAQSQSGASAENGPKITYARTRSYLQEDSIENALMFDMPSDAPRPTATKTTTSRAISSFDVDESDGEGQVSQVRSIHELRAAGRNRRFVDDADSLLGEIADHSASFKSRRRSALVELGMKMVDKSFAIRFVDQGYDQRLAAEISADRDTASNITLVANLVLLMVAEPPEHTVWLLSHAGAMETFSSLLGNTSVISKVVKGRQYNLSKAAQGSLVDFCETMRTLAALWVDEKPPVLTPHIIGLKALELFISRLRRLGDMSSLLGPKQIGHVVASLRPPFVTSGAESVISRDLAISVLEALSTSGSSSSWPMEALETIVITLPALLDGSLHLRFLSLRLCLNLTNDHPTNCAAFAREPVVKRLLEAISKGLGGANDSAEPDQRALSLDLLVLATGLMTNLVEFSNAARLLVLNAETRPTLIALVRTFGEQQKSIADAISVEESASNVALGYLAVMLGNLCQSDDTRRLIKSHLPGQSLCSLIDAVEEFVLHHQKVDNMVLEGEEGTQIWGAFTERLKAMLLRLKEVDKE